MKNLIYLIYLWYLHTHFSTVHTRVCERVFKRKIKLNMSRKIDNVIQITKIFSHNIWWLRCGPGKKKHIIYIIIKKEIGYKKCNFTSKIQRFVGYHCWAKVVVYKRASAVSSVSAVEHNALPELSKYVFLNYWITYKSILSEIWIEI